MSETWLLVRFIAITMCVILLANLAAIAIENWIRRRK